MLNRPLRLAVMALVAGAVMTALATWSAHVEFQRESNLLFNPFVQRTQEAIQRELNDHLERLESWRDFLELLPRTTEHREEVLFRSQIRRHNLPGLAAAGLIERHPGADRVVTHLFRFGDPGGHGEIGVDKSQFYAGIRMLEQGAPLLLKPEAELGLSLGAPAAMRVVVLAAPGGPQAAPRVQRWLVGLLDFDAMLKEGVANMPIPNVRMELTDTAAGGELIGQVGPVGGDGSIPPQTNRVVRQLDFGGMAITLMIAAPVDTTFTGEIDWTWIVAGIGGLFSVLLAYSAHGAAVRREVLSERARQLQASVDRSDQRFRDIVESSRDWVWETDLQGRYTYCSPSCERLFGYGPEQILGTTGEFLWPNGQSGGEGDANRVRVGRHLSGVAVTLESRSFPILSPEGEPRGRRGFDRDISQRVELESELHTLQGRLLKVIQAEGAGQTLMGLAHEINQPLAAIAAYNQACLRMAEADGGVSPEIVSAIRATAENAMLAGDIIRKFRGIVAAGQVVRTPLSLPRIVQDAVGIARSRIRSEEIRMEIGVGTELPEVLGDATLIKQVLLNLISNAVDAMSGMPQRTLRVLASRDGFQKVRVEVLDSGPGVPETMRDRIFEPYFSTKAGGLGMGLAISKAIVEAHGESIGCKSRSEGGATFWFTLGVGSE